MMGAQDQQHPLALSELLTGIVTVESAADQPVTGLCLDSRRVCSGDLFFACAGRTVSGMEFIDAAIINGASAVLWEVEAGVASLPLAWRTTPDGKRIPIIAVPDLSSYVGMIADRYYGQPSKDLFVTGITGTNGKTSCSHFLAQALSEDATCGLLGTLGRGFFGDLDKTRYTTPDVLACHQWLANVRDANAAHAVMEVSSHALDQGRVNGIAFDCAVFTNLSRDHLDYHPDMDHYGETKRSLFTTPGLRSAVINMDDAFGREIVSQLSSKIDIVTYGLQQQSNGVPKVLGQGLKLTTEGITMQVSSPWGQGRLHAPLLGRFNASNLLAVLSVLLISEVAFADALERMSRLTTVPGRMECLGGKDQPLVVVDFAHTPDALQQVLSALREHCTGKLWCVFGCGGERDKGKRPMMGEVVERLADYVVITDDNPRREHPVNIIAAIQEGMNNPDGVYVERARDKAIALALKNAQVGDVILVAGKGHETEQRVGNAVLPFSDVEEVRNQLQNQIRGFSV